MSDEGEANRRSIAHNIGSALGWDTRTWLFRDELATLLRGTLADVGTSMDTGGGPGKADLWVTSGGVEYFVTVTLSNAQVQKEAK